MTIKGVFNELDLFPSKEESSRLNKESTAFVKVVKEQINKKKIKAEVFLGGSFAKGTVKKNSQYEIDVFVRFDSKYDNLDKHLENIVAEVSKNIKSPYKKIHGSRDYFVIKKEEILFEIIPVLKIRTPKEAKNVTDLSYFHVNYVKKEIKRRKLAREIILTKKFLKAQNVYGAESYIHGISGYGAECLIISYGSFVKMAQAIVKSKEKIILDPAKKYKNKKDVFFEMNEARLKSPIIIVDPTFKERNVLAALNNEKFLQLKASLDNFLKHPNKEFFMEKKLDLEEIKRYSKLTEAEFLHVKLKTNKQEGDIAGSKLKKFADYLTKEMRLYFEILRKEFVYDEKQQGDLFLVLKSKKELSIIGPPVNLKKAGIEFKKKNKQVFEKNGYLHRKVKIDFSGKEFIDKLRKKDPEKIRSMGITSLEIIN